MLGTVCPATKLRLEAVGRAVFAGHTVRKLECVGFTTVTLSATEVASAGTPASPAMANVCV